MIRFIFYLVSIGLLVSCKKQSSPSPLPPPPGNFVVSNIAVDGAGSATQFDYKIATVQPTIKFTFSTPVKTVNAASFFSIKNASGTNIPFAVRAENNNSVLWIQPTESLKSYSKYTVSLASGLVAENGSKLEFPVQLTVTTSFDSSDKFAAISDNALLDLVQQQTFKYFWDFGHPVSGLARERNTSGDVVTTGGSGFGIMTIVVAVNRQFITRNDGLNRMQKIVDFLKNKAQKFHGAFPHWINGVTGGVVPFSTKDNGADLVETSLLMQGLLTARQYFDGNHPVETTLRNDINDIWNGVEWSFFRKGGENVLYWHYSPNYLWEINLPIRGWNEALITYVLAASSNNYSIPKVVYDNGWAANGAIKTGASYYGIPLPLGPSYGGPLFFSQYSFLGIDPNGLSDAYATYLLQNKNHTLINQAYCKANPKNFIGYSEACWGLTASDDNKVGYLAHDPVNDDGVISPTAALSSFPYTPVESMKALKFFYYKLGDKIWKEYGFVDAFNLTDGWFADSYLAIDQGPTIIMIENYRTGLLWKLFTSCPEVKRGMKNLGFQSPYL